MKMGWDEQLTDKEVYYLGKVVAHWGAIEYEVFIQTLQTFDGAVNNVSELPKPMKNLNFSAVLDLWEERVINNTSGERGEILRIQLQKIKEASEFRHTLVHSMLHYSQTDIGRITASRVKNREYIQVDISGDDLLDFYTRLSEINFYLRAPGGADEFAEIKVREGGGFSRRGLAMVTGHEILSDWISSPLKPESASE